MAIQIRTVDSLATINVTTSATQLFPTATLADDSVIALEIQPEGTIYYGDSGVTTTTGIKLTADQIKVFEISGKDTTGTASLYAIGGGTVIVRRVVYRGVVK